MSADPRGRPLDASGSRCTAALNVDGIVNVGDTPPPPDRLPPVARLLL
ncbi:MAG: hypothetical protein ACI9U2_003048 [Bradymonadia bacterium]|jgi:hypothetical protein